MWTLKVSVPVEKTIVGSIASKYGVVVQLYPLNANQQGQDFLVTFNGLVLGSTLQVEQFLEEFCALRQIVQIKRHENSFVCQYSEKEGYSAFYNPEIIYIDPWIIDGTKGIHSLHLGSWKREALNDLVTLLGKNHAAQLIKIVQNDNPSVFSFNIRPSLTKKQQDALSLAISNGYYEYPRKTSVQELAKIAKKSFSTYQAHLRKAEKKVLPAYFGKTS